MKKICFFTLIFFLLSVCDVLAKTPLKPIAHHSDLTLQVALQKALNYYELQIAEQNPKIQEDLKQQAGLYPNPRLMLGAEEYPSLSGEGGEFNLQWQQPWVISDRLAKKQSWANKKVELAQLEVELKKRALKRDVTQAFYTTLTRQIYLETMEELLQTAQEMTRILEQQYNQGKILLSEYNRSRLVQEELKLQKQTSLFQLNQAKTQLALYLNGSTPGFQRVKGNLIQALPTLAETQKRAEKRSLHPEIQKAQKRLEVQEANRDFQESRTWPDLQLNLGLRSLPFQNDLGALSSLTWPIPLNNANQGNIQASEGKVYQAQLKKESLKVAFLNRLRQALLGYQQSIIMIENYQKELIPLAQENLRLSQLSYQAGKLPYLALLDAQRSLYALQQKYIVQWGNFHINLAELEYFYTHQDFER